MECLFSLVLVDGNGGGSGSCLLITSYDWFACSKQVSCRKHSEPLPNFIP